MDTVSELARNLKLDQKEQTGNCSQLSKEEEDKRSRKWATAWRVLYGMKLVFFDAVDGDGVETRDYSIWKRGLSDLKTEEIDNGLKKVRDFDGRILSFPDFRKLCRFSNADLGLPEAKAAYYEACLAPSPKDRQRYSHPIVYLTGQAVGWWNLNTTPESKMFRQFQHHYNVFAMRVRNGEQFKVQAAIGHQQGDAFKQVSKEEYAAARCEFKSLKRSLNAR